MACQDHSLLRLIPVLHLNLQAKLPPAIIVTRGQEGACQWQEKLMLTVAKTLSERANHFTDTLDQSAREQHLQWCYRILLKTRWMTVNATLSLLSTLFQQLPSRVSQGLLPQPREWPVQLPHHSLACTIHCKSQDKLYPRDSSTRFHRYQSQIVPVHKDQQHCQ